MQCKVLRFSGTPSPIEIENEINSWLSRGWKLVNAVGENHVFYIFLVK